MSSKDFLLRKELIQQIFERIYSLFFYLFAQLTLHIILNTTSLKHGVGSIMMDGAKCRARLEF